MPLLLSPAMQKFAQDQIRQGYHDSVEGVIDDLLVQATTPYPFNQHSASELRTLHASARSCPLAHKLLICLSSEQRPVWDELFHQCALRAYVETWHASGQFPPDSRTVQLRAYQLYEQELAQG